MNSIKIILIIAFIPLIISCDNVYISAPQPVDSKNIYLFPKTYRGVWTCEADTIIIEKDYFKYIEHSEKMVLKHDMDSFSSYVLKDNKIYIIDKEQKEISEGFPYKLKNDTIYYQERIVMEIALAKKAFLRKVKKNYILNFKEGNQWWQVVIIRKDKIGNIIIGKLDNDVVGKFSNYKHIYSFKAKYDRFDFIEANWTKMELLEMINKSVFSDTLVILRLNNTFCD